MKTATKNEAVRSSRKELSVNLRPLSDRVIIKPEDPEEKSPGGILLPDTAKEKPIRGRVVAVGIGRLLEDGKRTPPTVKAGDLVVYGKYSGTEVKVEGVEYTIIREADVLGVLEQ